MKDKNYIFKNFIWIYFHGIINRFFSLSCVCVIIKIVVLLLD